MLLLKLKHSVVTVVVKVAAVTVAVALGSYLVVVVVVTIVHETAALHRPLLDYHCQHVKNSLHCIEN